MVGKYNIEIYNNRVHFQLEIKRNITIIQGDSATGKTTLIGLIADYERLGTGSGITLICEKTCSVLTSMAWRTLLEGWHDRIIFVDENMPYIKSQEFAEAVKKSDNYFVLIYRDSLPQLAYSIEEIYGMREDRVSQKYISPKKVYNSLYRIYNFKNQRIITPDVVVTEDSNAGYECFKKIFSCDCISAEGKTNISIKIDELSQGRSEILAIVDGAAFGADIQLLMRKISNATFICEVYAPESFEYLVLRSGIISYSSERLEKPYEYADSKKFFSWEQFFTYELCHSTQNTIYQYSKSKLNPVYQSPGNLRKLIKQLPDIIKTLKEDDSV